MTQRHALPIEGLEPGACRAVDVDGKRLALFNVGGTLFALDNTCLHRGGPLGEGTLRGGVVECPWHAWRYDVATGRNVANPALAVRAYPVRVEDGAAYVEF